MYRHPALDISSALWPRIAAIMIRARVSHSLGLGGAECLLAKKGVLHCYWGVGGMGGGRGKGERRRRWWIGVRNELCSF